MSKIDVMRDNIRRVIGRPPVWRPVPYRGPRHEIKKMQQRIFAKGVADRAKWLHDSHRDYFDGVYSRTPGQWPVDARLGIPHLHIVRSLNRGDDLQ